MRRLFDRGALGVFLGSAAMTCPLLLAGCSGNEGRLEVHPVAGAVFVNGMPADGCVVTFVPVDPDLKGVVMPAGTTDEFGSFRLTTYETDDGAPAGTYAVTLRWEVENWKGGDMDGGVDPVVTMRPDRLLGRFASPEKSELQATVSEGDNSLDPFHLEGVKLLAGAD